ncbi:MAG: PfkB family carbohydrate kinase [Solirubrobacteraceae bacterium]
MTELPRVTVFGPDPVLSVTVERRGTEDDIHLHPGGQGVWVMRAAAELGASPVLCCLAGGETGALLAPLLHALAGEAQITQTAGSSGSYVIDRRSGARELVALANRPAPARHEIDDLVSAACAAALQSAALVICNPFPPEDFPDDAWETLAGNLHGAGIPVVVDLSSPRLDHVLRASPDVVKLNDWELAEYVGDAVDGERGLAAMRRLRRAGAGAVVVTRGGEPIRVLEGNAEAYEVVPPRFTQGFREGCGDTMTGALAACLARGMPLRDALVPAAAAGAANFLRHGLGTGRRSVVESLAGRVTIRPITGIVEGTAV